MNVWTESVDIEAMQSNEWLNYRDALLDEFYKRGYVLKPSFGCTMGCNPIDEYTCFACECEQINQARGV